MLAVCLELCSTHEREKIDVIFETRKLCEALRDTLIAMTRLARRKPFLRRQLWALSGAPSCWGGHGRYLLGRTWTISCRLGKEASLTRRRHPKCFNDKTPASSPELRHFDSQDNQDLPPDPSPNHHHQHRSSIIPSSRFVCPRSAEDEPPTTDLDWVQEIHDFARLQAICSRHGVYRVGLPIYSCHRGPITNLPRPSRATNSTLSLPLSLGSSATPTSPLTLNAP